MQASSLNGLPTSGDRFRPASLSGRFQPDRQILLDNMTRDGWTGYEVLTPCVLKDSGIILVNRGWLVAAAARRQIRALFVAADPTIVSG
jgi:cytochrome oxidase assembly protein ShyY1